MKKNIPFSQVFISIVHPYLKQLKIPPKLRILSIRLPLYIQILPIFLGDTPREYF